jgi:hypothetical protein
VIISSVLVLRIHHVWACISCMISGICLHYDLRGYPLLVPYLSVCRHQNVRNYNIAQSMNSGADCWCLYSGGTKSVSLLSAFAGTGFVLVFPIHTGLDVTGKLTAIGAVPEHGVPRRLRADCLSKTTNPRAGIHSYREGFATEWSARVSFGKPPNMLYLVISAGSWFTAWSFEIRAGYTVDAH